MIVKICGLRTVEHALAAAAAGADLVGLMFAPSRRQITIEQALPLVEALRSATPAPQIVGVFVNAPAAEIERAIELLGLDLVQLSGDEPFDYADALTRPIIKSVRLDGSSREAAWIAAARAEQVRLMLDANVPGSYGGTGVKADWAKAALMAQDVPLLLAGGLNAENVAEATAQVQPWGVDVSSGVESAGVKDVAKIAAFVHAARRAC